VSITGPDPFEPGATGPTGSFPPPGPTGPTGPDIHPPAPQQKPNVFERIWQWIANLFR